jgi:hypothetical protein
MATGSYYYEEAAMSRKISFFDLLILVFVVLPQSPLPKHKFFTSARKEDGGAQ